MTKKEEKGIAADICLFTINLYVRAWFRAPSAPRTDLELIKEIDKYKDHNQAMFEISMKKIIGNLCYLSEEPITLAFFYDGATDDTKHAMVSALQTPGAEHPLKRITVDKALVST